jgi:DNA-binding XRE family transcriptional regulator
MIRTEREYEEARRRIQETRDVAEKQRASLTNSGLSAEHVELALSPLLAFQDQIQGELDWYERARQGEIRPVPRLTDIGLALIGLRLACGLTQRQLAERLGVNEAQISKDERNDYHGISVERAQRILDALNGSVTLVVAPRASEGTPDLVQVR